MTFGMPDYSKELQGIVNALNRPSWPVWLVALFSAFLGFVGGVAIESVKLWVHGWFQRRKMRLALYRELASMIFQVDNFVNGPDSEVCKQQSDPLAWQQAQLSKLLSFRGRSIASRIQRSIWNCRSALLATGSIHVFTAS